MGSVCACGPKQKDREKMAQKDDLIKKKLDIDRKADMQQVKLLLFGAGESGKSTLFKQMKFVYAGGYTVEELTQAKGSIIVCVYEAFLDLLEIAARPGGFSNAELDGLLRDIRQGKAIVKATKSFPEGVAEKLIRLWGVDEVREAWNDRSQHQLMDSLKYFVEPGNLHRLSREDYLPTQDDMLRSRVRTAGIVKQTFEYNKVMFQIIDVGGQRNERKKWMDVLGDATAVIFVIAVSEFDQRLWEDTKANRLDEAVNLLRSTMNFPLFQDQSFLLFFNKMDLFDEKLQRLEQREPRVNLDQYFPTLKLGTTWRAADARDLILNNITSKFTDIAQQMSISGRVFPEYVSATDQHLFKKVFESTANVILSDNMDKQMGAK